jgi:hypothetical protein
MLKFFVATVVVSAITLTATEAFAGRGRCGGGYYYAPAPAVAPAPAPAPMAQAPQGYRSYSYQPTQSDYRAYGSWVSGRTGRAYENAANKSLGRGF